MNDRLQELTVFARAADSGNFSRAARELGLSQPSVSRIIGELEARLGVTLLLRTTRRITVTDAGALFLDRAREILADVEDAEDAARGVDSLRGIIRLALPVLYGTREIIPRLPKFLDLHPLLRVEMTVVDARQDLVAEGADVAIRLGELGNSVFGARKLQTLERMLVASPSYLMARGTPKTPADLASHDCIFGPGNFGRDSWSFSRNGTETSVDVRGRIHTNSGPGRVRERHGRTWYRHGLDRDVRRRGEGGSAAAAAARLSARTGRGACGVSGRPASVGQGARAGRLSRQGTQKGCLNAHARRPFERAFWQDRAGPSCP